MTLREADVVLERLLNRHRPGRRGDSPERGRALPLRTGVELGAAAAGLTPGWDVDSSTRFTTVGTDSKEQRD